MKKKTYIIMTIVLFLFNIEPISAACTQKAKDGFKKVEDEYTVKYEYDKYTKKYNIIFSGSKPDEYFYQIYTNEEFECSIINDTTSKCGHFSEGTYTVTVKGLTKECNETLKTEKIMLPKYNKLADDPLCEGIEEYVLCNPEYSKEIDYESFVSRTESYRKNKPNKKEEVVVEKEKEKEKEKTTNETLEKIINFLKKYWIEIIVIVVFVILLIATIIVKIKSVRKSRYLE